MPLFERSGWSISVHSHRGRKNEFNLRFTTENDRAECNIEYEHNREFWIIVERRQTGSSDVYVRITLDGVEYDHFIFPRQDTEWISEGWQSADGSVFPYMWRPAKAMKLVRNTEYPLSSNRNHEGQIRVYLYPIDLNQVPPSRKPARDVFIKKRPTACRVRLDATAKGVQSHYAHVLQSGEKGNSDDAGSNFKRITSFSPDLLPPPIVRSFFNYKPSVWLPCVHIDSIRHRTANNADIESGPGITAQSTATTSYSQPSSDLLHGYALTSHVGVVKRERSDSPPIFRDTNSGKRGRFDDDSLPGRESQILTIAKRNGFADDQRILEFSSGDVQLM